MNIELENKSTISVIAAKRNSELMLLWDLDSLTIVALPLHVNHYNINIQQFLIKGSIEVNEIKTNTSSERTD